MLDLVYFLTNLFFIFLYSIVILIIFILYSSSINFGLYSGDIYLSLDISLSCSFVILSELFRGEFSETFVVLWAILLPVKSPVASVVFLITLFKEVLSVSPADCLA